MKNQSGTNQKLLEEISVLKQRIRDLENQVSEYKKAESRRGIVLDAPGKSESLIHAITEAAQDAILMMDPAGCISFWNPAAENIFGYAKEEAIGRNLHQFIAPTRFQEFYQKAIERFKTTGQGDATDKIIELQACRKNGEEFPVELSLSAIKLEDGWYAVGIIRDITARRKAENVLRETEKRFRLITDNVRDAIWLMDMKMQVTWVSPSAGQKRGFTHEELKRLPLERHLTPESLLIARELFENNFTPEKLADPREDISVAAEMELYCKDGSTVWADTVVTLLRDGQGVPTGLLGLSRDTTERRAMEEALRESERKYRFITEKITDIVWIIDMNLQTQYVTPSIQKVLGFSPEERMLQTVDQQLTPDSLSVVLKALAAELALEEQRHSNPNRTLTLALEYYHKDGSTRWLETVISGVRNDQDVLTGIHGVSRDITERKRVEEELYESRRRLADIIEFLPDATIVVDKDDKIIAWNRALELMTGIKKEDMLGKGDHEYAIPFYGCRRSTLIDLVLHPERQMEKQYTSIRMVGDIIFAEGITSNLPPGDIHLYATASPLHDSKGNIIAAIECFRDITERKKLAERLNRAEKMEALGTLAGGVAHDLNNVLGVLVGYSELLAETLPPDSPSKRYAGNILQSGMRGAAIIQDLLTLARRGVAVSEVVDLNKLVFDYLQTPEFEKLKFYHTEVKIRTEFDDSLLDIKGSPIHLSKTIMNLVSNAAEAISDHGEVTIRTENRYLDQPIRGYDEIKEGDYAILMVSDTGSGISANDLGNIFEPFYTKKVMGRSGTGLGLAVVWGTVKDHHGYIDVHSEEGKGSTFTLYFPVTREAPGRVEKALSPVTYMGKGESILVVDDVQEQRELAVNMLERLGYRVEAVAGGEEAVEYLKNRKADLIVLDMIMDPGIDGMETYRRILEISPGQKAVIVSGFSETDRVRHTQEMGAGAFVRKPYVLEKIGLAVKKVLM